MSDVHIADWQMPQPAGGADPEQLLRRQKEMMLDLYRMAPRLANLSLGELRAAWMARADAWWVRLTLVPRTQGLLLVASQPVV